jgi:hypothetical protein
MEAMMNLVDKVSARLDSLRGQERRAVSLEDLQSWSVEDQAVIHVAIMVEPYLAKICSGEKYIESRLTKVNISPFRQASKGDVILFKRSGGPIVAIASVDEVLYEHLTEDGNAASLADRFADGLGYEPGYVDTKIMARFASLLWLEDVRPIDAISLRKRSRQAWLTIRPEGDPADAYEQQLF